MPVTSRKTIFHERWYLMNCDFPNLNWARLRSYGDGTADVFDCDGRTSRFSSVAEAEAFLSEDEFTALNQLDDDDCQEIGLERPAITPPAGYKGLSLRKRMYVKRNKS